MPRSRLRRRRITGFSLVLALMVVLGLYLAFQRIAPLLEGSSCVATGGGQAISLEPSQAGIAATIAGVAQREALPSRAVTVAYAAAWQESKLRNLTYGDRDSVGIFQQYQLLSAYMARAFTGQVPHAVSCSYPQKISGRARLDAAELGLTQTFGAHASRATAERAPRRGVTGGSSPPGLTVRVGSARDGWAVAAWLVSHAPQYRITDVRYAGYRWTAADSARGWARSVSPTPPKSVELG